MSASGRMQTGRFGLMPISSANVATWWKAVRRLLGRQIVLADVARCGCAFRKEFILRIEAGRGRVAKGGLFATCESVCQFFAGVGRGVKQVLNDENGFVGSNLQLG